jgi:hypothetical protein
VQLAVRTDFRTFFTAGFGSGNLTTRTAQLFTGEVTLNFATEFSAFVQATGFALRMVGITLVFGSLTEAMTAIATVHQGNGSRFGGIVIVAGMVAVIVASMIAVVVIMARVIIMGSRRIGRIASDWC